MTKHGATNGYKIKNEHSQIVLSKNRAQYAPFHSEKVCFGVFEHMIQGEVENQRQEKRGFKINKCKDWEQVKRNLEFHLNMKVDAKNLQLTVKELEAIIEVMKRSGPDQYDEQTKRVIAATRRDC